MLRVCESTRMRRGLPIVQSSNGKHGNGKIYTRCCHLLTRMVNATSTLEAIYVDVNVLQVTFRADYLDMHR